MHWHMYHHVRGVCRSPFGMYKHTYLEYQLTKEISKKENWTSLEELAMSNLTSECERISIHSPYLKSLDCSKNAHLLDLQVHCKSLR